jgi:hypothetical protein
VAPETALAASFRLKAKTGDAASAIKVASAAPRAFFIETFIEPTSFAREPAMAG